VARPPHLDEIQRRGTLETADGRTLPLLNHVKRVFLDALEPVVRATRPRLIVEIGMCYGVSSLVFAQALADAGPGGTLVSIDPFESSLWHDVGRLNVERAGLPVTLDVRQAPSHLVLPRLLEEGRQADFVFVDGNHTRDYVRTDAFFARRLLRVGGIVAFDDARNRHIRDVCRETVRDYRYEEVTPVPHHGRVRRARIRLAAAVGLPRHPRVRCFRKTGEHEPV
jgi:predicted O-methyltransferase YrrM